VEEDEVITAATGAEGTAAAAVDGGKGGDRAIAAHLTLPTMVRIYFIVYM
jgi:hypothetical protein